MTLPLLLDLFCGAGGCTKGYQRAGFRVVGVDLADQPRYCGEVFIQADALEFLAALVRGERVHGYVLADFAAIHGSPPCHASSSLRHVNAQEYVDLIGPTRDLLEETGLPYVIENVEGAALIHPTTLCGSSFGLDVRRHRLFETNWSLMGPPCAHGQQAPRFEVFEHGKWRLSPTVPVYGSGGRKAVEHWPAAMAIDWMSRDELAQAIPPAYTELIGHQLMQHLRVAA